MSLLLSYPQDAPEQPPSVTRGASEIAAALFGHGVRFERWLPGDTRARANEASAELTDDELLHAYAHELQRARSRHGYVSHDVVRMKRNPSTEPDEQAYRQKVQVARSKFLTEHVHAEDEV